MEQPLSLPGQSSTLSRIHETSAKFQRYKILLRRRWWFLLLTASIGVCVQALRSNSKPTEYASQAKLVAGSKLTTTGNGVVENTMMSSDFYGTIIETVESAEMKRRALNRMKTLYPEMKDTGVDIRVSQTKGSTIFNVVATGPSPRYTQNFLDALLDVFVESRKDMKKQQFEQIISTFLNSAAKQKKEYEDSLERATAFRKANDILNITQNRNESAENVARLNVERSALLTERLNVEMALKDVDNAMTLRERSAGGTPAAGATTAPQSTAGNDAATAGLMDAGRSRTAGMTVHELEYSNTKKDLIRLENERQRLLISYKAQHPLVLEVDEKVADANRLLTYLSEQLRKEAQNQLDDINRRIAALDERLNVERTAAQEMALKIATDEGLQKDLEAKKKAFDDIYNKLAEVNMQVDVTTDFVGVQDKASMAVEMVEDPLTPIAIGLVIGLGAGVVILLLFDRLDDRMNSYSEFQALFPNEAVLGQIPEQRQRGDVALLRASDDRHLYAEAFRNVRSSILFKNWQGKMPKTILVTSAVPNEGKTTVTSNLAVTMALSGSRVLLADCDLRRGGVNELFKLPVTPGLSEVLKGNLHWRDAVQETGVRKLDFLARGEVFDQTSEMLLSQTAEEMLKEMAEEYDYVIFDSAPVLVADDTASFAPKLDTVLFVVRMSSTMARLSGKALDLLYERQVNVGGVILNRSSSNLKEYTYYNYASYYYAPKPTSEQTALPGSAKS
jgi:succinoglycan biosynthesis transport protein ExoP